MARVMVIEDEPSIAAIVAHKLRREGHDVHCRERLEAADLDDCRPELIVLDLEAADAMEVLRRSSDQYRVLALTAFRDDVAPARAREAGAIATLAKPFKPTVLARLVAQITS